jgi:hypothetical protein
MVADDDTDIVHVPELMMTKEQFMEIYKKYFGNAPETMADLVSEGDDSLCFRYNSDKIRFDYLKSGLNSDVVPKSDVPHAGTLYKADDLVIVKNYGDYAVFYEMFVDSCWNALYEKPEYSMLRKKDAVKKLVQERFSKVANAAGEKVAGFNWDDDNEILSVKITNSKIPAMEEIRNVVNEILKKEFQNIDEAKKGKKANPWAVCTSKVGRSDKDKYERCVIGVKKSQGIREEAEEIEERSVSKKQQRFMGQVHALQSGQLEPSDINPKYREKITKVARTIKPEDAKDFAKTKLKGLPEKKKKSLNECGRPHSKNGKGRLIVKSSADNMSPEKIGLAKRFISACLMELGIREPVSVYLTGKRGGPIKTTASFDPDSNDIWVYTKNRNMLGDVLRSIAHEIRHLKQNLDGVITGDSGKDGSPHENEANSFSGLMIRKFGRENPGIYQ